ncbi:MAG: serine hydroxymethyltransferase [Rhodospirillaceae bacterium]|nr:serine hydroxymethyltransferase [Rhodospirillaceae bacterium]
MAQPGEVILEYTPMGRVMRVCAIDVATGTEVVIQGPIDATEDQLKAIALAKLSYVMNKRAGVRETGAAARPGQPPRRGLTV